MEPLELPKQERRRSSRIGWAVLILLGAMVAFGVGSSIYVSVSWDITQVTPPWGDRSSLFAHIEAHLPAEKYAPLKPGGDELPDADRVFSEGVRWASGAVDGLWGAEITSIERDDLLRRIDGALRAILRRADAQSVRNLYAMLGEFRAVAYVDELVERLPADKDLDRGRLGALGRWLATRAPDREAVKIGISLLGVSDQPSNRELLLTIGRHDEFTLFSAVAVTNLMSDPEPALWELARGAHGWGRIQAVWRLTDTSRQSIRSWLLREGYRNSVMNEYLAYSCAVTGKLDEALAGPSVDDALLRGAGDIIVALIQGGPAEDIDDYEYAAIAVGHYLRHVEVREVGLEQLLVVARVRAFLGGGTAEQWRAREERGWDPEWREDLLARCERFIARRAWPERVRAALAADDRERFLLGVRAAAMVGIDPWEFQLARLRRGEDYWSWVMQTDDRSRAGRVVALARELLPLRRIASGAAEEPGLGPAFEPHNRLGAVLQELARFPGLGWPLIRAGMQSPVTRNRNHAVQALEAWGRRRWPAGAEAALQAALAAEPDESMRAWIARVLGEARPG